MKNIEFELQKENCQQNDTDIVPCDVQSFNDFSHIYGEHETEVLQSDSEADLFKYFIDCKKNPGHIQFIPYKTFSLKHLPKDFQDNDLFQFIRAVAELTVRVDVKITSSCRPEFWPKTNVMYPFYCMREKTNLRTGSGMVRRVYKYTDGYEDKFGSKHAKDYRNCWCTKCQESDSPSNVWWEFIVFTATHVVFDDIETSKTTLRLFYDGSDSPVVILDKVYTHFVNIENDICKLKCVSCNEHLGDKLDGVMESLNDLWESLYIKYKRHRDMDKMRFIVSHPHGCFKQVSIGQWKEKYRVGHDVLEFLTFTYTACTCPGSSGATVHCLGYGVWYLNHLVHIGTKSGINHSGVCHIH